MTIDHIMSYTSPLWVLSQAAHRAVFDINDWNTYYEDELSRLRSISTLPSTGNESNATTMALDIVADGIGICCHCGQES